MSEKKERRCSDGRLSMAPLFGLPDGPAADALDDLVTCWRKHDERYQSLMSGYPFLGLIPK